MAPCGIGVTQRLPMTPTPVGSLDGGGDPSVPGAVGNSIFTRADKGDSLGLSGQRL
jgi:hypothetical protein